MDQTTRNFFIICVLLGLTTGYLRLLPHGQDVPLRQDILTLNTQIGNWTGKPHIPFSPEVLEKLQVDDYLNRNYQNSRGETISLYIGYYRNQRQGDLIHSPQQCLPGGGWNITKREIISIPIQDGRRSHLRVNRFILQKDDEKMLAYYWYEGRGRTLTSEYLQKVYLILDAIRYNRTDEALIRLLTPIRNDNLAEADQNLRDFTQKLAPILSHRYFPPAPGV